MYIYICCGKEFTVESSLISARHSSLGLYMPKMDPVETAASMLDDPSSGSNTTI